jgi:hypothetical protein
MKKRTLETYRFFPYLAWGTIAGFSLFVYQLTQNLSAVAAEMESANQILETQSKQDPATITKFNH